MYFMGKLKPEYIGSVIVAHSVTCLWIFYFLTHFYQNFAMTLFVAALTPVELTNIKSCSHTQSHSLATDQVDRFWTSHLQCLGQSNIQKLKAILI